MQLSTAFCIVWLLRLALGNADEPKIFCYYRRDSMKYFGYERMEVWEIDPSLCTHVVYLSVGITGDGSVIVSNPQSDLPDERGGAGFQKVNALRERNEKLKTLVSTSGKITDSPMLSKIVTDAELRSKFVKNVVDFLLLYKFDGFNIMWQWPTIRGGSRDDVQNYVLLLKELRTSFDEHKLILSVVLEGIEIFAKRFYDIPEISKYVDFIQLDITCHQHLEKAVGHSAPLYPATKELTTSAKNRNINATVHYWLSQGTPAKQLILGTPFHGISYDLGLLSRNKPIPLNRGPKGEQTSEENYPGYTRICLLTSLDGWTTEWDEEQRVPYSYSRGRWISYDNSRSMAEKGQYVRSMGLGGVSVWSLDQDDRYGECGERSPLLNALNRELRENVLTTPKADTTDDPEENAKKTCAELNLRYIQDPQNCAKFWLCQRTNGRVTNAKLFSCATGLHFDTDTNACKSSDSAKCN